MKINIILIYFFSLIFTTSKIYSQAVNLPAIAEEYKTKKFDVAIFPETSFELFDGPNRFTPSKQDVEYAEDALLNQLPALNFDQFNQYDTPIIDKNLSKYKRQYFGYYDKKRNRILFINCIWEKELKNFPWLNERVMTVDGGSYFWNVKYNINTNELFDLDVNGHP
jgi:hypothetical protein